MKCVSNCVQNNEADSGRGPLLGRVYVAKFSAPLAVETTYALRLLRTLHRAALLGCEITEFEVNGRLLGREEVRMLNFFAASGGAWRASALSLLEASDVIDRVLHGHLSDLRRGKAGGGRLSRLAENDLDEPEQEGASVPHTAVAEQPPGVRRRRRRRKMLDPKAAAEEMAAFDRALGLRP